MSNYAYHVSDLPQLNAGFTQNTHELLPFRISAAGHRGLRLAHLNTRVMFVCLMIYAAKKQKSFVHLTNTNCTEVDKLKAQKTRIMLGKQSRTASKSHNYALFTVS